MALGDEYLIILLSPTIFCGEEDAAGLTELQIVTS